MPRDDQPIAAVHWTPADQLYANDYNPNRVAPAELQLLRISLLEDGWTAPVLAHPDGEVIDGHHRWTLALTDPDVAALTDGQVPVVHPRSDALDPAHRRMSTIRHNRARGSHYVVRMADLIAELHAMEVPADEIGRRVIAACRSEYHGTRSFGGPIEAAGRLRYIDGCSDTLLAAPPLLGDPCLNHLHFPPGIIQTMHTHPSVRCGAIARGAGYCETPTRRIPLEPGAVWIIWAGSAHRFITDDQSLDVIAYHPDSDWGPTDEEHPMLNRTWVDGIKIDNTGIEHDPKQLIR